MKRLFIVISAFAVSSFMAKAQQGMGVGNNNPLEMLDVTGAIKIGTNINTNDGTIRWTGSDFEGRKSGSWVSLTSAGNSGTVTSVGVTTVNGVSGTVSNPTTTPSISLTLGAITPTSIAASGTVTGSNLSGSSSGTNTGDQTISLTGPVTGSGTGSFATTITNSAVTYSKIQNVAASRLLGNPSGSAAAPSEISLGSGLSFSGTSLTVTGFVTSVTADNGLTQGGTAAAPTIKLGGALTQTNTTITQDGAETLIIANNSTASTVIDLQNTGDFEVKDNGGVLSALIVKDDGNVGVGTNVPTQKLQVDVNNNGFNIPLFVKNRNGSVGSANGVGIGFNSESSANGDWIKAAIYHERTTNFGVGKLHFLLNSTGDGSSVSGANIGTEAKLTIQPDGNVGIGTTGPTAKLVVNGSGAMWNHNELKFYDDAGTTVRGTIGQYASNSDMVMASNVNNAWLRIGANNSNIAFMPDNTYAGGSSPAVVISANKRMGIGTTVPIAPLHVESQTTAGNEASYGNFWYYAGGGYAGGACCGGNVAGVSIHASGRVMASEFDAFSDARIKNIIGVSNNQEDLQTLLNIEITDYKMKDALKGDKTFKKVIAQQVKTVYPQATSTITEVVPDVYQMATINNGMINLSTDMKVGDKVKLIFEEGNEMVEVVSTSEGSFTVNSERSGDVFVYGREVNDFHVVDYEAIAMLNVSATQELFKLIQQLQKENTEIKTELKGYASLQSDIERLKEALGIDAQSSINK
ncbi:MAG: tail fiber domain-containing protein [Flavobacteriales bacterium]|nr:tail fiber domain-containing protein [Flavobacteriales bacterium]